MDKKHEELFDKLGAMGILELKSYQDSLGDMTEENAIEHIFSDFFIMRKLISAAREVMITFGSIAFFFGVVAGVLLSWGIRSYL